MSSLLLVTTVPEAIRGFLLPYAAHFRRLGWRVDAAAAGLSSRGECVDAFERVWDIDWSRNPLDLLSNYRAVRQIREAVRLGKYDIVHVHTPIASFLTRFAVRHLRSDGVFVVYTAHGFHFHADGSAMTNFVYRTAERVAAPWTDHLIVINDEDYRAALQYHLMPSDSVTPMPGIGLDVESYSGNGISPTAIQNVRLEFGLQSADSLFLCIGEFTSNKRQSDIVNALAQLRHPNIHVVFCGTGPMLESVERLSRRLRVRDQVHFAGFRRDVPVLLKAARATLLVSAREGYPRSVMESLAAGTPVIGTNVRGTRSLVQHGCGILVDPGSPEQIAQAVRFFHECPEEATRMGYAGQLSISGCDIRNVLEMHEHVYSTGLRNRHLTAVA